MARLVRDGRRWRIGTPAEVAWIASGTTPGLTITSAIPPVFAAYATVVLPAGGEGQDEHDRAVLALLSEQPAGQPWWLGYLDTGVADLPDPSTPKVLLYSGWSHVVLQGGPEQALSARQNTPWHSALPELLFPNDRSWLVSTLWDDDWRCVGGPAGLVDALLERAELEIRLVAPAVDMTPPGHDMR